jgi:membrane protein
VRRAGDHYLLLYSSAVAFRALVSLIPLILLGLGLLGALGLQSVWHESLAPPIEGRVTAPVYEAINFSVDKILRSGTFGLIAFASLLVLWNVAIAVRTVMQALNTIHDAEETRSLRHRVVISFALAVALVVCLIGSVLVVVAAPRAAAGADVLLEVGRWVVALALLVLAVGLLVRYAPAERPEGGWTSLGSVLVVVTWVGASLLFRFWLTSVGSFKTATGSLTLLLFLTGYVFVSSAIFLVGVELDELLRVEAGGKAFGVIDLVRAVAARRS